MSSYFMTLFFFNILYLLLRPFSKKIFWILKNQKKPNLTLWQQKLKNWKKSENWYFFQNIILCNLNLNSTSFLLSFDVNNIYFPQNLKFYIFLAIKFTSIPNFTPAPLVAKLASRGGCFGYPWTARDHNLHLWSSFTIQVAD